MHDRGVFHADLKPKNLIYDQLAGVKIIDYGLARVRGEPKARVQGTPEYMAPETAASRLVNAGTDIYNLGATMYHLVARRPLAPASGGGGSRRGHAARVRPVASLNASAPSELCDLIHWCIDYDPARPAARGRKTSGRPSPASPGAGVPAGTDARAPPDREAPRGPRVEILAGRTHLPRLTGPSNGHDPNRAPGDSPAFGKCALAFHPPGS